MSDNVKAKKTPAKRKSAEKKLKVLFVASEAAPFVSTGGLGQVVSALPEALQNVDAGVDVRVVIPLYASVRQKYDAVLELVGETSVNLSWRNLYCGVYQTKLDGVTYYFVDNEYYFLREGCYGYFDDGERFAYFAKSVFSVIELTGFIPDVIHSHDWQSALTVIYHKALFAERLAGTKSVFTIHNMEYQGQYPSAILGDVFDLPIEQYNVVAYDGCINLMKGAMVCADAITTVSPSYAEEIKRDCGFKLEKAVNQYAHKLIGIVNGINTRVNDPQTDSSLKKKYSAETLEDKAANKAEAQKLFGLKKAPRKMLFCVVSRLVSFKGIDLLAHIMEDIFRMDAQFLLLGTGDSRYEHFFSEMAVRHPGQIGVSIAYNPEIASKIYAGADCTLMPSLSEPCGLAQMISCRYGTIPIVRETGGLRDTIKDCRLGEGNGFVFREYDAGVFLDTVAQAHDLYTNKEDDWKNLMRQAMASDFSWESSAKEYLKLYRS